MDGSTVGRHAATAQSGAGVDCERGAGGWRAVLESILGRQKFNQKAPEIIALLRNAMHDATPFKVPTDVAMAVPRAMQMPSGPLVRPRRHTRGRSASARQIRCASWLDCVK
jgi:hypothetical protein